MAHFVVFEVNLLQIKPIITDKNRLYFQKQATSFLEPTELSKELCTKNLVRPRKKKVTGLWERC